MTYSMPSGTVSQWQYLFDEPRPSEEIQAVLNKYGKEGWELVSFSDAAVRPKLIFKRPLAIAP